MPEILAFAGIGLMVLGAVIAFFALGGILPGSKKAGGAVALVLIVAGLAAGGFGGLFAPLAAAPGAEPDVGVPEYMFRLDAAPITAGNDDAIDTTVNVEPGETTVNILAALGAGWQAFDDTADSFTVDGTLTRLDAGKTTDVQIAYIDVGTVDSILDVGAGTSQPLLDVAGSDNHWDVTWGGANVALDSGSRYSISTNPGDVVGDVQAGVEANWPAFDAALVGESYSFTFVIAGIVVTVNCVVTAA